MNDFNLDGKSIVDRNLIEIVKDYTILIYNDSPILYSGLNYYNDLILGCLLDEDDENQIIYSYRTIISNDDYNEFINGNMSYYEIIKNNKNYIFLEDYNSKFINGYEFDFIFLPENYHPSIDSFFKLL